MGLETKWIDHKKQTTNRRCSTLGWNVHLHLLTKFATCCIFIRSGDVHSWYRSSRASRNSSRPRVPALCCPHRLTRPWGEAQRQGMNYQQQGKLDCWRRRTFPMSAVKTPRLYLEHLIESRAAAGDWVQRGRRRPQVSLAHVFELQHGFFNADNLRESSSRSTFNGRQSVSGITASTAETSNSVRKRQRQQCVVLAC